MEVVPGCASRVTVSCQFDVLHSRIVPGSRAARDRPSGVKANVRKPARPAQGRTTTSLPVAASRTLMLGLEAP
jgi:hypothetical protein